MSAHASVSVITPVGPRWSAPYLREAGRVLDRNDAVAEWLVVCDGASPDDVRAAIGADDRVTVLGSGVNAGTAQARNIGLAAASGAWVYAFDADDVPLPFGVDRLVAASLARGTRWAAGLAYDVAADGETVVYKPAPELAPFADSVPIGAMLTQAELTGVYPMLCSGATVLGTDVARAAGGWDEVLRVVSEDVSLIAWVSERYEGAWCGDYVMAYRKHPDSQTATHHDDEEERFAAQRVRERARRPE